MGLGIFFARVEGALNPPGGEYLPEKEVETLTGFGNVLNKRYRETDHP